MKYKDEKALDVKVHRQDKQESLGQNGVKEMLILRWFKN